MPPLPSQTDLFILDKIKSQGDVLIEDLQKIFAYQKPRTYKLYLDKSSHKQDEDEKAIYELIEIIQKFNKVLSEKMEEYHDKNEENKVFYLYYNGYNKLFNSGKHTSRINNDNIFGNLLYEYKNKNFNFKSQFLKKNIFSPCGLLPTTKKQTIDYFDSEIQNNGQNSVKSIKCIHFIEKLYKQASKLSKSFVISNDWNSDVKNNNNVNKEEEILRKNKEKIWKREIKFEKKEIEKLKKLLEIANEEYNKLNMDKKIKCNINRKNRKKTINFVKFSENISLYNLKYDEKNLNKKINSAKKIPKLSNLSNTLKSDTKNLNNQNNDYFSKTTKHFISKDIKNLRNSNSFPKFNSINNNTINTNTLSTKFTKGTFTNAIFSYKNNNTPSSIENKKIVNKLDPIEIMKNTGKSVNFSRNYNNKSSSELFTKTTSSSYFNPIFKLNKQNLNSSKNSNNFNSNNMELEDNSNNIKNNNINNNNSSINKKNKRNSKKIVLKKIMKKNSRKINVDTNFIRRRQIPQIYEELKNCRNIFSIAKSNSFLVQKERKKANELFSRIYDKKKIEVFDDKKTPMELFNNYYNMKENLENCTDSEKIYKKYNQRISDNIKDKIKISNIQDKELKNKYYEYVEMIIKKKIDDEDNGMT